MNRIFNHKPPSIYKIHRKVDDNIHFIIFTNQNNNPLSNQGIKIKEKTYRLVFFEKSLNNLSYFFEKNIILKFYNRGKKILVHFIYPKYKKDEIYIWNYKYATTFVSLSWNEITKELDCLNTMSYEFANNHMTNK